MTTASKPTPIALPAETRNISGKGSARALRREGKIPGILYGKGQEPVRIALPLKEVALAYARGRFRSKLVDINLDGTTVQALPKDVQFNPVTDFIEHVDFIKIEPGLSLRVNVPVKITGQDKSMGLKRGGVLNVVRHEIEFFCAPDAIPTHIEINVQPLDIGASLHIDSIELPQGVTPTIKRNFTVLTIAGRNSSADEDSAKPADAAAVPASTAKKEEPKKAEAKK